MASSQKRKVADSEDVLEGARVLLIDIEGTTTPISFVKDTLVPYFMDNLDDYLEENFHEMHCQTVIERLRLLAEKDGTNKIPHEDAADKNTIVKAVIANVKWQIAENRCNSELKQLQGHIWKEAYEHGKIEGVLFPDVVPTLRQLIDDRGMEVFVYSAGSIESQKLIFTHSNQGNVMELFSGFFDTMTGSKVKSNSYAKITEKIGVKAAEIMFLTDNPLEAAAAVRSGLKCNLVIRKGNAELSEDDKRNFHSITSFYDLVTSCGVKPIAKDKGGEGDSNIKKI